MTRSSALTISVPNTQDVKVTWMSMREFINRPDKGEFYVRSATAKLLHFELIIFLLGRSKAS
jgi:hypothetical protein